MPKFTTRPTPMFSFWCLFPLLCHRNVTVLLVYTSFSSSSSFNQSQFTFQMSSEFCCASYTDFFFDSTMFFFFFLYFFFASAGVYIYPVSHVVPMTLVQIREEVCVQSWSETGVNVTSCFGDGYGPQ